MSCFQKNGNNLSGFWHDISVTMLEFLEEKEGLHAYENIFFPPASSHVIKDINSLYKSCLSIKWNNFQNNNRKKPFHYWYDLCSLDQTAEFWIFYLRHFYFLYSCMAKYYHIISFHFPAPQWCMFQHKSVFDSAPFENSSIIIIVPVHPKDI